MNHLSMDADKGFLFNNLAIPLYKIIKEFLPYKQTRTNGNL